MSFVETIQNDFKTGHWVKHACVALALFNLLGLLAAYHWFFDIFVNFKLPYLLGAFVLFGLCVVYRYIFWALGMAALAIILFLEIQFAFTTPFAKPPAMQPNFTLVQYNKYYYNLDLDKMEAWIRAPDSNFDVMIVNESSPEAIEPMRKRFGDLLPYQSPDNFLLRHNDITVLSKWPFTIRPLPMQPWKDGNVFNISRIHVYKKGLEPVMIYAYHTQTPVGPNDAALRNFELENFSTIVASREDKNAIMVGDWNVTPYSPHFKNLLKITGMHYQNYGLLPRATFPRQAYFNILQMPIDHVLYDDALRLTSITKGPSNGSDHQSLIAKFYVNTTE